MISGAFLNAALVRALVPDLSASAVIHLFGGLSVSCGDRRCEPPEGSKRLLAFVALNPGPNDRRRIAGTLWPDGDDLRAAGNLRSALWRLRRAGIDLIEADKASLRLRPGTVVDALVVSRWAADLIDGETAAPVQGLTDSFGLLLDLLPGWYDEWVSFERERIHQRVLHALDALCRRLVAEGRHAAAIEAAVVAFNVDPLRESTTRSLIEAHLAEGNLSEAHRSYRRFRDLLRSELGIRPSDRLEALVRSFLPAQPAGRPGMPPSPAALGGRAQAVRAGTQNDPRLVGLSPPRAPACRCSPRGDVISSAAPARDAAKGIESPPKRH